MTSAYLDARYVTLVNDARDRLQQQVHAAMERAFYHGNAPARACPDYAAYVDRGETRFCQLLTVAGCAEYMLLTTDPIRELWMERDDVRFLLQPISPQEFYRFALNHPNRGEPLYYCIDNLRLALWPTPATQCRLGWYHVPVRQATARDIFSEMAATTRRAFVPQMRFMGYNAWYDCNIVNSEAESKSIDLLKSWLTPKQLKQFDRKGSFDVTGQASGKRYRIKNVTPYNVVELTAWGVTRRELCFVPIDAHCIGDIMLAQKIMLETDEQRALRIANVKGKSGWLIPNEI